MLTLSAHTEQGGDMEVVLGLMVILQGVSHGKLFGFFFNLILIIIICYTSAILKQKCINSHIVLWDVKAAQILVLYLFHFF